MTLAVLLPLLLAVGSAPAPVYFEQTTVLMAKGKPTGPGVTARIWYSGERMRMEPGNAPPGTALVLRLDQGKAYRMDPARKRVIAIELARLRDQSQTDVAMAGQLMGVDAGGVKTEPLPQPRVISGYRCSGYRLTAGSAVLDVYLTRRIPAGISAFTDFLEWSGASQAMGGLVQALRALPGFPLEMRSHVNVMGEMHETLSTISHVKVGPHAASLFAPPLGWTVEAESGSEE
jgi:Domain of unknown function (DUF4412)